MRNLTQYKLGFLFLILPIAFTACAQRLEVVFLSQPEGAIISEIGSNNEFGNAPTRKRYIRASTDADEEGCYLLDGVKAQWASGAVEKMGELKACKTTGGYNVVTLVRPSSHPNIEKDLEVATDLSKRRKTQGISLNGNFGANPLDAANCISCSTQAERLRR